MKIFTSSVSTFDQARALVRYFRMKGWTRLALATSTDATGQEMPAVIDLPQGTIQSTLLPHGGVSTLGLVFTERSSGRKFVYYTDCKSLTPEAVALARGADAIVLDGLRPLPHPSHMSISEAVAAAQQIGAKETWLTHLTHVSDHATTEADLPAGVKLAYDGLRLKL